MKKGIFAPKATPEVAIEWQSDTRRPFVWGLGTPPFEEPTESDPILRYVSYSSEALDAGIDDPVAPRPSGKKPIYLTEKGSNVVFSVRQSFKETKCFPVFWEWDFGDGYKAYGEQVSHTYSVIAPQGIQVVLTVTDNKGRKWRAREQMYVYAPSITPVLVDPRRILVSS